MEVLWAAGECSVADVVDRLNRRYAYTTVLTTIDRLFRKGIADRKKFHRHFLYTARLSHQDWQRQRTEELVAFLRECSQHTREVVLSSLLEALGQDDITLLEQFEVKIRAKRGKLPDGC